MKRSIARKWAKALESGDYKQGRGQLRKGDSFCCLGVLCNLHAQEHPEVAAKQSKTDSYMNSIAELPIEVSEWAKMHSGAGYFLNSKMCLIGLNDTLELTFPEIATIILKQYKEL